MISSALKFPRNNLRCCCKEFLCTSLSWNWLMENVKHVPMSLLNTGINILVHTLYMYSFIHCLQEGNAFFQCKITIRLLKFVNVSSFVKVYCYFTSSSTLDFLHTNIFIPQKSKEGCCIQKKPQCIYVRSQKLLEIWGF